MTTQHVNDELVNKELADKVEVLYEDSDIVAVYKPAGLLVHEDRKNNEHTLVDWFLEKYPLSRGVGEPGRNSEGKDLERSGVVHRLDRDTSGVLLLCKTQQGFECLKKQFQEHIIQKQYLAFVYGEVTDMQGLIDRPIGRSSRDFRLWSAQRGARGVMREAVTEYEVVQKNNQYSYIYLFPRTGRTHQLRVHMKAIHHPIVADPLYAPTQENSLGFKRLALHAKKITFSNVEGGSVVVDTEFPDDFSFALEKMSNL